MIRLSVIEEEIAHFNYDELEEAERIIQKEKLKRKLALLEEDINTAKKESAEGKTLVAADKKGLITAFMKMIDDED